MLTCITIGSVLLVTSLASIQCCHHTTTPNNTDVDNTTTDALQDSCTLLDPNGYVDDLISKLKNKTIDTVPLPDHPGPTSLKEGQLSGLTSLKRVGNATVYCNETTTTIEVLLSFEELKGRYNWERKVLLETLSGQVFVNADTAEILFRVSQERENGTGLILEELSIKRLTGIHTKVTGLGVVTWALSVITEPVANIFKKTLSTVVEGSLKDAIGSALRDPDAPIY